MAGLHFGRNWNAEATEPYFQVTSAVLIIGVVAWMMWRTRRNQRATHDHDILTTPMRHQVQAIRVL